MATLKCKMCGGDLNIKSGEKYVECEYCGTTQTIPSGDDEKRINLFNRANRFRLANEFDRASGIYDSIVAEFPNEAEAYWGLVLCKYGIEYVDDPVTLKKIPTCHRSSVESVLEDEDYLKTLEKSDVITKALYQNEADQIERIRKQIIDISAKEDPYDVFICYKETDDTTSKRTEDSSIAQDIYTELTRDGYKVFFSRITLRDKAGEEYEPYIYAALMSAKVMLVIGTKYEFYDAVWVKNEWSRYLAIVKKDPEKKLVVCYKTLDPKYDLPKEFRNLQALDIGEITFFKNLLDNVRTVVKKAETTSETGIIQTNIKELDSYLKRAYLFLDEENWERADEYFERVLDINPECAKAYVGKLMVELKVREEDEIASVSAILDKNKHFANAVRFADDTYRAIIFEYAKAARDHFVAAEREKLDQYNATVTELEAIRNKNASLMLDTHIAYYGINDLLIGVQSNWDIRFWGYNDRLSNGYNLFRIMESSGKWQNIVAIDSFDDTVVALRADGHIVYFDTEHGEQLSIEHDFKGIVAEKHNAYCLKENGTVVTFFDKPNDSDYRIIQSWQSVNKIIPFRNSVLGYTTSGSLLSPNIGAKISANKNVIALGTICSKHDFECEIGICEDGKIIAKYNDDIISSLTKYNDIISVKGRYALKRDGVLLYYNYKDERSENKWKTLLKDVVTFNATNQNGTFYTACLTKNGSLYCFSDNALDERVSWIDDNDIVWGDYISLGFGCETVAIKRDGSVVCKGGHLNRNLNDWKLFSDIDTLVSERNAAKNMAQEKAMREQHMQDGVCQYCGGKFTGIFTKKCSQCGRKKDY